MCPLSVCFPLLHVGTAKRNLKRVPAADIQICRDELLIFRIMDEGFQSFCSGGFAICGFHEFIYVCKNTLHGMLIGKVIEQLICLTIFVHFPEIDGKSLVHNTLIKLFSLLLLCCAQPV